MENESAIKELLDTMDDWIDAWHAGPDTGKSLHQYLQMSWEEYQTFVQRPLEWAQNILRRKTKVSPFESQISF